MMYLHDVSFGLKLNVFKSGLDGEHEEAALRLLIEHPIEQVT